MTNFSKSTFFCRYCHITRDDFIKCSDDYIGCAKNTDDHHSTYNHQYYEMRTVNSYDECIKSKNRKKSFGGIIFNSNFNKLKSFHVWSPGRPPCLAHDLLEGVLAYDIKLYLQYFMNKNWFTWEELNEKIEIFQYSETDKRDRPASVSSEKDRVSGNAWQVFTLLKLFPLIICNKMKDINDEVWQTVLLISEILEIVCAVTINKSFLPYLQSIIQEYLALRVKLFPKTHLCPKHHYLTHYPMLLIIFGPLILV